jgi:hypothetical protein
MRSKSVTKETVAPTVEHKAETTIESNAPKNKALDMLAAMRVRSQSPAVKTGESNDEGSQKVDSKVKVKELIAAVNARSSTTLKPDVPKEVSESSSIDSSYSSKLKQILSSKQQSKAAEVVTPPKLNVQDIVTRMKAKSPLRQEPVKPVGILEASVTPQPKGKVEAKEVAESSWKSKSYVLQNFVSHVTSNFSARVYKAFYRWKTKGITDPTNSSTS